MEDNVFKPKLRVTLLNELGAVIQDRLVDANPEYYAGPKIQHKGPIRLEVTLANTQDINNFKQYLDQLVGNLPIKVQSAGRGRPVSGSQPLAETPREDILQEVTKMAEEGKNQNEVIKYLRDLGFVFILTEDFLYYFKDFEFKSKDVGEKTDHGQYLHSLAWMVRCIKRAKDPRTDKFDPMILFGFNIYEPSKKVVPYLYKERQKPLKIQNGPSTLSFTSVEFTKLPKYMLESERLKFSVEQRQLILNPEKKPSKFFLRWVKDVEFPDSIKPKIEEILTRTNENQ